MAVRLKDAIDEALGEGLRYVRDVFEERRKRREPHRRSSCGSGWTASRRRSTTRGFRRADLVIEAVFEDLDLKRKVLAEVEAAVPGRRASWRATPRRSRSGRSRRAPSGPERVLGMHFFSPVHKMPLLEVVVTPETEAAAVATAVAFGRRLGKHVIVVRDGPGFYTSRTLAPYMNEAARARRGGRGRRGRGPGDDRLRLPGRAHRAARRGGDRRGGQGGAR